MADKKVPRVLRMDVDEVDAALLLILLGQEDVKNQGRMYEQIMYAGLVDKIRTVKPNALKKVSTALETFFTQETYDAVIRELIGDRCVVCGGYHKPDDHPSTDAKSAQAE